MVKVRNLTSAYGKDIILNDVSFNLQKGRLLGVLGPNGSGKSTLIRSFFRICDVLGGDILLDGKNILEMNSKEISKLIAVQRPTRNIGIKLTVEAYVTCGQNTADTKKLEETMERFELDKIAHKRVCELSDGQTQRAMIAQAVIKNPKLYLLDEPTAHLDMKYKILMLREIKSLLSDSCAIAVIHDLEIAKLFCDDVLLLKDGKVFASDGIEIVTSDTISKLFGLDFGGYLK
jgi:iron complex transport system ATP-binding protein